MVKERNEDKALIQELKFVKLWYPAGECYVSLELYEKIKDHLSPTVDIDELTLYHQVTDENLPDFIAEMKEITQ